MNVVRFFSDSESVSLMSSEPFKISISFDFSSMYCGVYALVGVFLKFAKTFFDVDNIYFPHNMM